MSCNHHRQTMGPGMHTFRQNNTSDAAQHDSPSVVKRFNCSACKERHLRCDRLRPKCTPCAKSRKAFACVYPESQSPQLISPVSPERVGDASPLSTAGHGNHVQGAECRNEIAALPSWDRVLQDRFRGQSSNESLVHELPDCTGTFKPNPDAVEIEIFEYYIRRVSLSMDIASPQRHFCETVGPLAVRNPLLYFACLSYSSHLLYFSGLMKDLVRKDRYYDTAIRLLIKEISDPNKPPDYAIIGTTTAILRVREQFTEPDAQDSEYHLRGATSVFAQAGNKWSVASTDLATTAFWLFVRQNIRVGFLHEQEYTAVLANVESASTVIPINAVDEPEVAWTNRITLLLATLCNECWRPKSAETSQSLLDIAAKLDTWIANVPKSFEPWCDTKPEGSTSPFPTIRFFAPWHTLAWYFYYAAQVVLAVYYPARPRDGDLITTSRYIHTQILEPTRRLCAICLSDNTVGTQFNGAHMMGWCARFLTCKEEQQAVWNYLLQFQEKNLCPHQVPVDRLKSAWDLEGGVLESH